MVFVLPRCDIDASDKFQFYNVHSRRCMYLMLWNLQSKKIRNGIKSRWIKMEHENMQLHSSLRFYNTALTRNKNEDKTVSFPGNPIELLAVQRPSYSFSISFQRSILSGRQCSHDLITCCSDMSESHHSEEKRNQKQQEKEDVIKQDECCWHGDRQHS